MAPGRIAHGDLVSIEVDVAPLGRDDLAAQTVRLLVTRIVIRVILLIGNTRQVIDQMRSTSITTPRTEFM